MREGIWLALLLAARAQRLATVHEVQPSAFDTVHAVWINGPTYSQKLPSSASSAWPEFQANVPTRSGLRCTTRDDTRYTGYDDSGVYCEAADTALDDNAHLLLHSGRLAIVVDAGGLRGSGGARNLFPKLGAVDVSAAPRVIYDALPSIATSITMTVACSSGVETYVLGTSDDTYVQVALVRQGHAVTQVTLTGLEFQSLASGGVFGPCETFVPVMQSDASFAAAAGRRLSHQTFHRARQSSRNLAKSRERAPLG